MKKLIFGVGLVLTVSIIHLFNACSADETEEAYMEQTSKKELLLAKSKEFAKKYKVKMWLNEENMDYIVRHLTIEQMEQDYIRESQRKPEVVYFETPSNIKPGKLKFRTRSTDREELISFNGTETQNFTLVDTIRGMVKFTYSYEGPTNTTNVSATYSYNYNVSKYDDKNNVWYTEKRSGGGNIAPLSTSTSGIFIENPEIYAYGTFDVYTDKYFKQMNAALRATRGGGFVTLGQ